MDRIYRTVNIKDQETQRYYSHLIQHDARQRCPALIVLKEEEQQQQRLVTRKLATRQTIWTCRDGLKVANFLVTSS